MPHKKSQTGFPSQNTTDKIMITLSSYLSSKLTLAKKKERIRQESGVEKEDERISYFKWWIHKLQAEGKKARTRESMTKRIKERYSAHKTYRNIIFMITASFVYERNEVEFKAKHFAGWML